MNYIALYLRHMAQNKLNDLLYKIEDYDISTYLVENMFSGKYIFIQPPRHGLVEVKNSFTVTIFQLPKSC